MDQKRKFLGPCRPEKEVFTSVWAKMSAQACVNEKESIQACVGQKCQSAGGSKSIEDICTFVNCLFFYLMHTKQTWQAVVRTKKQCTDGRVHLRTTTYIMEENILPTYIPESNRKERRRVKERYRARSIKQTVDMYGDEHKQPRITTQSAGYEYGKGIST